jgi:hypothetical protein
MNRRLQDMLVRCVGTLEQPGLFSSSLLRLLASLFSFPHVDINVLHRRQRAGVVVLHVALEQLLAILQ